MTRSKIRPSKNIENYLLSEMGVSRETLEKLQAYVDLLAEWQNKTNLVSNNTLNDVWQRHICDSLQCSDILPNKMRWLDLGTGAGFPGLVLAIVNRDNSNFDMQLVESSGKKCAFLRRVIRETGAIANVTNSRIESVVKRFSDCEVVSARALAPLDRLFDLTHHWLEQGTIGLFPKGRDYLHELEKCRGVWEFDLVLHPSRIEKDSVLLEISNVRKSIAK